MNERIGFMQGRLSPLVDGAIQAFPWQHWRQEFPLAEANGFALMEWTLDQERLHENPLLSGEGRAEIQTLGKRHGLAIRSLTGDCFMQAPFYKANGKGVRDALLSDFGAIIEACGDLGIAYIVVPLVDGGRLESPEQLRILEDGLAALETRLLRHDVCVVFESDYGPRDLAYFIRKFPAGGFGVNYDIGNSAALGYLPDEEIRQYGDRIYNVHIKDRLLGGTTVPLGQGDADFASVFAALERVGYRGPLILQTARAVDDRHAAALCRYRDMTLACLDGTFGTEN